MEKNSVRVANSLERLQLELIENLESDIDALEAEIDILENPTMEFVPNYTKEKGQKLITDLQNKKVLLATKKAQLKLAKETQKEKL